VIVYRAEVSAALEKCDESRSLAHPRPLTGCTDVGR